jgi:uncharacterized membrane protein
MQPPHSIATSLKQRKNAFLLGLSIVFLALFIYSGVIQPLLEPLVEEISKAGGNTYHLPVITGGIEIKTVFMMLFSVFHAAYVLGWRHTLLFFGITVAVSWSYEHVGVETGLIYGTYHYTDALGVKLGHVPIIIPIAWFMMIYPSYITANLIGGGRQKIMTIRDNKRNNNNRTALLQILGLSLLSAVIMTAWDLVVDPYLSAPTERAWIWENGGHYFGVPLHNFGGWLLTTFTIYFLFQLLSERRFPISPSRPLSTSIMALPLIGYCAMMVTNIIPGEPPELRIIGPVVMGIPLAIAAFRLLKRNADTAATYTKQASQ